MTAPVQPSALPRPALDAHTHLDMIDFQGGPGGRFPEPSRIASVVAAAGAAGIVRIVTVGTDLETSRWSARCAAEHDAVYAAVAIHPNETQATSAEVGTGAPVPGSPAADEVLAGIEALARSPRVVAVGETGLDYYRHHAEPDVQRWWYREHIKIAKGTGKALMIHDREAHADVLRILAEEGPPDRRHLALPRRGQGPGPGHPVRHGNRHRHPHLRPLVTPCPPRPSPCPPRPRPPRPPRPRPPP